MKQIAYIIIVAASLAGISSCVKKDPIQLTSAVRMIPLSPNASPVDLLSEHANNVSRLHATTVGYSTSTGTVQYVLPYYYVPTGSSKIRFRLTGAQTDLGNTTQTLEDDIAYSAFLIDSAVKLKVAFVTDDLELPSVDGLSKVRFFHFSPNAPAVNVWRFNTLNMADSVLMYSARTFNDQATNIALQDFVEIPNSGAGQYFFRVRLVSNPNAFINIGNITFQPNRIYTIAARGFVGGAGSQALAGWWLANKAN
jgi:hypothetical protein